jgi:glutamyl-tRNA(Gln) amidotransferase subunit E
MYPETDIPPTQITGEYVREISSRLPALPEQRIELLTKEYGLNQKLTKQILDSEYGELFEIVIKESLDSPTTVAAILTETMRALKRDGVQVDKVSEMQVREIFRRVGRGELAKEALPDLISWLSKNEEKTVQDAVGSLGLGMLSTAELERIIDAVIDANRGLVEERGGNAFGLIMGMTMKEVRGKARAESVSELIKKKIAKTEKRFNKESS